MKTTDTMTECETLLALYCCTQDTANACCRCPLYPEFGCTHKLGKATLKLLDEQEIEICDLKRDLARLNKIVKQIIKEDGEKTI